MPTTSRPRPDQYTKEKGITEAKILIFDALQSAKYNEIFKMEYGHGHQVIELSEDVSAVANTDQFSDFKDCLPHKQWNVLTADGGKVGEQAQEKVCREMCKCKLDTHLREKWRAVMDIVPTSGNKATEVTNLLLLHIIREAFCKTGYCKKSR